MENILEAKKIETNTLELIETPTSLTLRLRNLVNMIRAAALTPDEVHFIVSAFHVFAFLLIFFVFPE